MMVPGLNDLVYVMGVGQCASGGKWARLKGCFHWSRFPRIPTMCSRYDVCDRCVDGVSIPVFVEDGAVGWSCKCSSGRHCRRIGGHRSRDRARPSCSLCHRGYSQTARRRGQDTRVAALEFCVHGIVVHLRLGLFANTNGKITGI